MHKFKLLFIHLICLLPIILKAQNGFFNTGADFVIKEGSLLYVNGDLQNLATNSNFGFRSNGTIQLTGNLVNNYSFKCDKPTNISPNSNIVFSGSNTQTISGTSTPLLYDVIINKSANEVVLNQGISIFDTLNFISGNINLNGKNILMQYPLGSPTVLNHPWIKNENNQNHIYGDSGFVYASTQFDIGVPTNLANMGLDVKRPASTTTLTVERGHTKQLYAGNGSIKKYFNVKSNNSALTDSLKIIYVDSSDYAGIGINKNKLKLFVSPVGDMDYVQIPSTNSLSIHTVAGTAVSFTNSTIGISQTNFRITLADIDCANPPVSALILDTLHFCAGGSAVLDAGNNTSIANTSLKWNWSTGATTQTITVTTNTVYQKVDVTLTDVRGCITKDSVIIAPTAPIPISSFIRYSACFGYSDSLKNTSSIVSGSITSYQWQFGDSTSLTTSNTNIIKKKYTYAGTHYVTLIAISNYGCSSSITHSVVAIPLPTANFSNNYNCSSGVMQYSNTSISNYNNGAIVYTKWNLGIGVTDTTTTSNPTKIYSTSGTYTISLLVKDGLGCKDSIQKSIVVATSNQALFAYNNACSADTINFINNSVCNSGGCIYLWDFADGTYSTIINPKKIYATSGVYNVKLKVLSSGCTDSITHAVYVNPSPVVGFTSLANTCFGNTAYFTNTSSIATGSIQSYTWNFGNGNSINSINASQNYTVSGVYQVSLSATSDSGCVSVFQKSSNITAKPIAQYNVNPVCLGQPSNFISNSIGNGLTYNWDFGNTITSNTYNPNYGYLSTGTFSTSLIVTDSLNCSDTAYKIAVVNSIPNPALGGTISTCGTTYTLDAGAGNNYLWQPVNVTTQSLTVTNSGPYTVTVTDLNGCVGSDNVMVNLGTQVKLLLGPDTIACGFYTLNAGYPGSNYLWNTGATTQTITTNAPGTFIVTVTDQNSCTGKDTVIVGINTLPTVSLGANITQCKTSNPVILSPVTNGLSYLWNNNSTASTLAVNNSGHYAVTVSAANGCKASDTIYVNLLTSPIVSLGPDITKCGSYLLDAQNIGDTYFWSAGNNTETITVNASGSYWVQVTNPSNTCVSSDTVNVIINAPISVFLGNDTSICSNTVFVLNAQNPSAVYNWSTGVTTQTISVGSSGAYGVTVSNGGCSAVDYININLVNAPTVNLGNNLQYLCNSSNVSLNAGTSGTIYNWGSSNGFQSAQQQISVNQPGVYWVSVSNGSCATKDTVQIIESPQSLSADFIASTIDTVGIAVQFVDVTQPAPTTWLWNFGDGFTSTDSNPAHVYIIAQTYNVSLTVGNGYCSSTLIKAVEALKKVETPAKPPVYKLELVDFSFYPNPTTNDVNITIALNDYATIYFAIYDTTGRVVYSQNESNSLGINQNISLTGINNGMYFMQLNAESGKGTVRHKDKIIKLN